MLQKSENSEKVETVAAEIGDYFDDGVITEEEWKDINHKYEVLLTQFNKVNMDMLDIKQENQGLKVQKKEFITKIEEWKNTENSEESEVIETVETAIV